MHSYLLKTSIGNELRLTKSNKDELGYVHNRYDAYYKNVRIEKLGYIIHEKDGIIVTLTGNYYDIENISSVPKVSESSALKKALQSINAKKYDWEIQGNQKLYPKAELLIVPFYSDDLVTFKLCYKFEITAIESHLSEFIYIDAITSDILIKSSKFQYTDVQAAAQTRYSGTQTIWTDPRSAGYYLAERDISGHRFETLNLNKTTAVSGGTFTYFIDQDNNWTATEYDNTNFDNIALDIHWAGEKCFEYFKTNFNRNGYQGYNSNLVNPFQTNWVHYGQNFGNSFYYRPRSSDLAGDLVFGDGNSLYNPFGSLDNYAHEYGHGLFDFTVGITPTSSEKEYGAIQESLSDIWAAIIEAWAAPNKNRWVIGEEIVKTGGGLRNLSNPNSTNQPDTYQGTSWVTTAGCSADQSNDYCGKHTNSGVMNYWFYLLTMGGSGINDLSNAFNVSAIGMNKAASIVYRAETVYMPYSNINQIYLSTRDAMIQAAIDLYGQNSCEVWSVTNAWYAVGVGGSYSGLSINGDSTVCTTSNNYTISNLPLGATVQWQASPLGIVTINSPNSPQTTLTKNSNATITLTATVNGCGSQVMVTKPNIVVGGPIVNISYSQVGQCQGGYQTWYLNATSPNTVNSWQWTVDPQSPGSAYIDQPYYANTYVDVTGGYVGISLDATNSCGTTHDGVTLYNNCDYYGITASPNPTTDNVTVGVAEPKNVKAANNKKAVIYQIRVIDQLGTLKKQYKYSGVSNTTISLNGLMKGSYTIQAFDGTLWGSAKVIKQ